MKKIEKLEEFNWVSGRDAITIALCNTIIRKQNEIIDHLNSQDQEENEPEKVYVDPIVPNFTEELSWPVEYKTRKQIKEMFKDTPEEINPYEKITKEYARAFAKDEEKEDIKRLREEVKDTPEQTESDVQEWEKKWEEFFLYVINDKNWVDGRPEWKGNVYITLYNAMKDFIRQLLAEREREVINEIVDNFNDLNDMKFRVYLARRLLKLLKNE